MCSCDPRTLGAEARGWLQVSGQPRLSSKLHATNTRRAECVESLQQLKWQQHPVSTGQPVGRRGCVGKEAEPLLSTETGPGCGKSRREPRQPQKGQQDGWASRALGSNLPHITETLTEVWAPKTDPEVLNHLWLRRGSLGPAWDT